MGEAIGTSLAFVLFLGGSNLTVPNDGYPYGTATAQLQDGKFHLIFDQTTATQEGVVPITEDIVVDKFLGSERVVVKAGQYVADFSQYEFGEIYADLIVN